MSPHVCAAWAEGLPRAAAPAWAAPKSRMGFLKSQLLFRYPFQHWVSPLPGWGTQSTRSFGSFSYENSDGMSEMRPVSW